MKSFQELREKTLTPAEKKKREEIAKAMEKDNPDMPMDKKMAIATAQAKKVAEAKGTGVKKFVKNMRVAKTSNPDMKGTVVKGGDNLKKQVEVEWDSGKTTMTDGKYIMSIKKNESVEEARKYRTPTAAEIEADKKKGSKGKSRPSITPKSASDKLYKNLRGGLKSEALSPSQRAQRDAKRAMGSKKEVDPADIDTVATKDDEKGAKFNIVNQLRKAADSEKPFEIQFADGKKGKVTQKDAAKVLRGWESLRKPMDKEKFQKVAGSSLASLKRIMSAIK